MWSRNKNLLGLLVLSGTHYVNAECSTFQELNVEPGIGLSFVGFVPNVSRFSGPGMGNKILLKNYDKEPVIAFEDNKYIVSTGSPCTEDLTNEKDITESGAALLGGFIATFFSGSFVPLAVSAAIASASIPMVAADSCEETIDVEIYTDIDDLIAREYMSGQHEVCPPETFHWKHHPDVFGGFEGCVGEKFMVPCAQDGQTYNDDVLASKQPFKFDLDTASCLDTGYNMSTSMFWILWGNPLDKYELISRTGTNPTVKFPFIRGAYPSYAHGSMDAQVADDSLTAKYKAFDMLVYIDAFRESERDDWAIAMTEGAESGMVTLYASKALEIARTTCNRNIYVLSEAPSYGYSNGDAADVVNKFSDDFYAGEECLCFATGTCNDPIVSINTVGWLPGTDLPSAVGGDNITYVADSASFSSPWFETMVFPENPTGTIKKPRLPNANRRICDGVYTWPMYFGARDYVIPMDERPDCASWSFSITKIYSASVRAGFILFKKDPETNLKSVADTVLRFYSMSNGLFSQWSWQGQMQIFDIIMAKPYTDPTSWIGAYSELMDEKWQVILEGFANCPALELTNEYSGAYGWFMFKEPYLGIQDSFLSSFFMDVLGVKTTTYNWGFRGSNPSDYYGENYGTYDFTRFQLYRDISIYKEVARRAKIVCADTSAHVGDFISIDDWAAKGAKSRRLNEVGDLHDAKTHRQLLKDTLPHLSENQLDTIVANEQLSHKVHIKSLSCAPEYTTTCLFNAIGSRFDDDFMPEL